VTLHESGRLELTGTPYLAGAASPLSVGLGNAVRFAGLSLAESVRTVTTNPSRLLRLGALGGREAITLGARGNLTLFRQDPETLAVSVRATVVDGSLVYSEPASG
jgi:N-acetylglucosamine-6-phosphate deacetylase